MADGSEERPVGAGATDPRLGTVLGWLSYGQPFPRRRSGALVGLFVALLVGLAASPPVVCGPVRVVDGAAPRSGPLDVRVLLDPGRYVIYEGNTNHQVPTEVVWVRGPDGRAVGVFPVLADLSVSAGAGDPALNGTHPAVSFTVRRRGVYHVLASPYVPGKSLLALARARQLGDPGLAGLALLALISVSVLGHDEWSRRSRRPAGAERHRRGGG